MKKIIVSLFIILIALSGSIVPIVPALASQSHVRKPNTTIVGGASLCWGCSPAGNLVGASVQFYIDRPLDGSSNSDWRRSIEVDDITGANVAVFGLERATGTGGFYCSSGFWLFFARTGRSTLCTNLDDPSQFNPANLGTPCIFKLDGRTSGLMEARLTCGSLPYPCKYAGCSDYYSKPAYVSQQYLETVNANYSSPPQHIVYGGYWNYSAFQDSGTFAYVYQNVPNPGDCYPGNPYFYCPAPSNPPQMYWGIYPGATNNGGQLDSCVYLSGSSCSFRS